MADCMVFSYDGKLKRKRFEFDFDGKDFEFTGFFIEERASTKEKFRMKTGEYFGSFQDMEERIEASGLNDEVREKAKKKLIKRIEKAKFII
jgi:hypothetical protein